MSVSVYQLAPTQLEWTKGVADSLDAASAELPSGVFTTVRTYGGDRIVGLSAHLDRLVASLRLLGSTRRLELAWVRSALRHVVSSEKEPNLRLRVTVPLEGEDLIIAAEPFVAFARALYEDGARCATIELPRLTPEAKSTDFIAASRDAKRKSNAAVHELLLLDSGGHLLEGMTSNFFAVHEGVLRTAGSDVLQGVTRGAVLELARARLGVRLDPVALDEIDRLTEAFITSSSREVMPVVRIDEVLIGTGTPGPVTASLAAAYRAHLGAIAEPL